MLEFLFLRLDVLDGERYDSSTNLHSHGMMSLKSQLVLQQDDRAELRGVVFDVETILFALDDCVASTDTDIVDTHLTFMTSTKFELTLLGSHSKQVDVS